jgi:hypothetical protein
MLLCMEMLDRWVRVAPGMKAGAKLVGVGVSVPARAATMGR